MELDHAEPNNAMELDHAEPTKEEKNKKNDYFMPNLLQ